ncbi:MAG TPA: MFS transporter [Acidimicrobiia bacterium]|nr:MFS transporter [Acidimicrobiia bacterium]
MRAGEEEAAANDGVWTPARRALTVGLVVTITLVAFEAFAIATVMPLVKKDLGGIELYGWVFSAFFLGSLIGIVFTGRAADHIGPARPFALGLLLFGAGLLAGGLAPSMGALVAARAVQGIGAGVIPAVAYIAVGRGYPARSQPRMFAVISTAWVIPGLIGPAIAGAVADATGWRWVLLGLLPLVLVAGVATAPALARLGAPGGAPPEDRRVDALLLTLGAALVLGGASVHELFLAVALVVIGAMVGARSFVRITPPGTTRLVSGMPAAIALRGLATFAFFGTDAYVTLTLTQEHHTSATVAGAALTAAALTWTAGSWVQERRIHMIGARVLVRVGFAVIALGAAGMVLVAATDVPIAVAVLAWGIGGLGMGLSYSPVSFVVLGAAPEGGEGVATAALQLCDTLGVALGTGASGAIIAAGAALHWDGATALELSFAMCTAIAVVAGMLTSRLPAARS